jgi:RNA polymerase sigma-70 factor (ECF subfamily)
VVAGALHQVVQAGAFAAQHQAAILAEVEVVVIGLASLIQADNPDILLLHRLQRAGKIDHLRHAHVLAGAGGGLGDHRRERRRAAFGQNHAVHARAIGRAQQSTQVVRVFHTIERQKKALAGRPGRKVQQVFQGEELALPQKSHDPLVGIRPGVAAQLIAGLGADANVGRPAQLQHPLQPGIAASFAFAGNADVVNAAGAGAQRLFHRMQTVKNIHPSSVAGLRRPRPPGLRCEAISRSICGNRLIMDLSSSLLEPARSLRAANNLSGHRDYFSESDVSTNVRTSIVLSAEAVLQAERENAAIALGLKRHDPELLDQLIETYQHRLMRYLMFLTSRREVAEDLFQEVWIRVLKRGSQYNGKARFDTWIFTIARNLVIDLSRKRTMASLDEMREGGEDERPFEIAEDGPSPLEQFQFREDAAELLTVLHTLDRGYREVLTLRFHEEMSLEEIATVTRAPLSTVKSRLYRGLAALKPQLVELRSQRSSSDARAEGRA